MTAIGSSGAAGRNEPDRTVVALARLLRNQREQGAAVVQLIAEAAPTPEGKGRFVDVRV